MTNKNQCSKKNLDRIKSRFGASSRQYEKAKAKCGVR
jgi:hypothetical protein